LPERYLYTISKSLYTTYV